MKILDLRASMLVLLLSCSAIGCGSDGSAGGGDDTAHDASVPSSGGGSFKVFPPKVYTGFDGKRTYQAPVITVDAPGSVSWSLSDPSIASLTPEGKNVMIRAKKAGTATLTATSNGKTQTAAVTVYAYTDAQYEAGAKRYNTPADADNPACVSCHGVQQGANRPNHTPTEIDADTDGEIANTFVTGKDPEGRPIAEESEFRNLLNGKTHMWKVTADEKTGLLAYLRALEPNGYPEYDAPTDSK